MSSQNPAANWHSRHTSTTFLFHPIPTPRKTSPARRSAKSPPPHTTLAFEQHLPSLSVILKSRRSFADVEGPHCSCLEILQKTFQPVRAAATPLSLPHPSADQTPQNSRPWQNLALPPARLPRWTKTSPTLRSDAPLPSIHPANVVFVNRGASIAA